MSSKINKTDYQTPYLQRHPHVAQFIGTITLVICAAITIYLAGIILNWFKLLIGWLSTLDAVIIVALITGTITIICSVIKVLSDNHQKRREYLSRKREESYAFFIDVVYKILQNAQTNGYDRKKMTEDIFKFSSQITLWGSAEVVNKWVEFRANALNNDDPLSAQKNLYIVEDIMNAMRKDLGLKKVPKGNLLAFFVNDVPVLTKKR